MSKKKVKQTKSKFKTVFKWIYFEDVSSETFPKRKTKTFYCYNKSEIYLGVVEWNCKWRQYWFVVDNQIGLAKSCLDDTSFFINQLMELRKGQT